MKETHITLYFLAFFAQLAKLTNTVMYFFVFRLQNYSAILKSIIESADRNINTPSEAHRFNENLKYFCTYIYLVGGKLCYEVLSKNLYLPATSTIGNNLV